MSAEITNLLTRKDLEAIIKEELTPGFLKLYPKKPVITIAAPELERTCGHPDTSYEVDMKTAEVKVVERHFHGRDISILPRDLYHVDWKPNDTFVDVDIYELLNNPKVVQLHDLYYKGDEPHIHNIRWDGNNVIVERVFEYPCTIIRELVDEPYFSLADDETMNSTMSTITMTHNYTNDF